MVKLEQIPEYMLHLGTLEEQYNLPTNSLAFLLRQESSGGDPNFFLSEQGARGPFQILPRTARGLGVNPDDPIESADGAARYLREGLQKHGGDIEKAFKYYHGGPDTSVWGPKTRKYAAAGMNFISNAWASEPNKYDRMTDEEALAEAERMGIEVISDAPSTSPTTNKYDSLTDEEAIALAERAGIEIEAIEPIRYRTGADGKQYPVYTGLEDEGIESVAPEFYLIGGGVAGRVLTKGTQMLAGAAKSLSGKVGKKVVEAEGRFGTENVRDVAKDLAIDFVFDNLPRDVPFSLSALRAMRNLAKGKISMKEAVKEGVTDAGVDWILNNLPVNIPGGATTIKIALGVFGKGKSPADDILGTVKPSKGRRSSDKPGDRQIVEEILSGVKR